MRREHGLIGLFISYLIMDRIVQSLRIIFAAMAVFSALSALTPAMAKPENGEQFKDWAIRCEVPKGQKEERCSMFQAISVKNKKDASKNQRLMVFQVAYPVGSKNPGAVITVPLGIFLPAGVAIKIDDGKEIRVPLQFCFPDGCRAGVNLNEKLLWSLRAGKKAEVTVVDAAKRKIPIPVSLNGFTAALKAIGE